MGEPAFFLKFFYESTNDIIHHLNKRLFIKQKGKQIIKIYERI